MQTGRESQTAVMVCMARAMADGRPDVAGFTDPTALALLPEEARVRVERFRVGVVPKDLRGRFEHVFMDRRSKMMVARTIAIDEAMRAARSPLAAAGHDPARATTWIMKHMHIATADRPTSMAG